MNYDAILKVTEVLEELATTLRGVLEKHLQNQAEWEELEARIEEELKQLQEGK